MLASSRRRTAAPEADPVASTTRSLLIPKNLPISSLFSRFWIFTTRSTHANLFRINNVACVRKKIWCTQSTRKVRRRPFTYRGRAMAAVGDHIHLLAFRAGALHVGKTKASAMTATQADEAVLRPAQHTAELAAQYTIGTAYDHFRHFLRTLLPLFFIWRARSGLMIGGCTDWCHLAGEARDQHVPTQSCLRRELATLKESRSKREWPESRRPSHDGARFSARGGRATKMGQPAHNVLHTTETTWPQSIESSK